MNNPVEPVSPIPPGYRGRQIMKQRWQDLTFLHWRVDPARLAAVMPPGVRPDIFDGSAWVGLIPFRMVGAGVGRGPAVPWLGTFAETNVRTYSVDDAGVRGVVFLSLETERLAVMVGARLAFGIKYMWARMSITQSGDRLTYKTSRKLPGPRGAGGRISIRRGAKIAEPDPLMQFLTARWGLHSRWFWRTLYVPNKHQEWTLHSAELLELDDSLLAAAGFPDLCCTPPDSVLFAPGVDTTFGFPQQNRVADTD